MTATEITPLNELHLALSARMVEFAGWSMPVSYPLGVLGEHLHCREKAALFDVSHMGQVELRGDQIAEKLEALVPAGLINLQVGSAKYSFLTNEEGGILDDLIITRLEDHWYLVVNASMRDQDLNHLRNRLGDIEITERRDRALIALQGPASEAVLAEFAPDVRALTFMQCTPIDFKGTNILVSRLGYTGEDGFEIALPAEQAETFAKDLLADDRVEAAGLGARDSLRLEAGLCLYGNDIDPTTSPVEAGLNWAIPKRRREEGGFPGAHRIQEELNQGVRRKLVGIRPEGRAPARQGTEIIDDKGEIIGQVTSGGFSPSLKVPISMGYVQASHAEPGTSVTLLVRGKPQPAVTTKLPFVTQNYKR